jgi:hypothetical protein
MTKTIQSHPCVSEGEEENISLLLSVFESLDKLNDKLSKLDYVLKRKNKEQISIFDGLNKLDEELNKLDCVPKGQIPKGQIPKGQIIEDQNKGENK